MSDQPGNKLSEDLKVELLKQYRFQWEPAQDSFVLLYPEGMVKLPGSAGEIMKRVDGSKTVSQIVADLEAAFPGADLRQDVIDFNKANLAKYKRTWYADRYRLTMELFAAALENYCAEHPFQFFNFFNMWQNDTLYPTQTSGSPVKE